MSQDIYCAILSTVSFRACIRILSHPVEAVWNWRLDIYINLVIQKNSIDTIPFTHKRNNIYFNYFFGKKKTLWRNFVNNLGVVIGTKLYFHQHVNYIVFLTTKLLQLTCFTRITHNSSVDSLTLLSMPQFPGIVLNCQILIKFKIYMNIYMLQLVLQSKFLRKYGLNFIGLIYKRF